MFKKLSDILKTFWQNLKISEKFVKILLKISKQFVKNFKKFDKEY